MSDCKNCMYNKTCRKLTIILCPFKYDKESIVAKVLQKRIDTEYKKAKLTA